MRERYPNRSIGTAPLILAEGQRRTDAIIVFTSNALKIIAVIDPRNEEFIMVDVIKKLNPSSLIFDPIKAPIYFGQPKKDKESISSSFK